jgi:hypothetical protein
MESLPVNNIAQAAHDDFQTARRKAFLTAIGAALRRQPNELLAFNEVERILPIQGQVYRGMRTVPLAAIRGSVDRYHDFDRNFLPNQTYTRPRWESVDTAMITDVPLPAIALYQVGELYFVKDGNHRVSVARERGAEFIDAEVIECLIAVPLPADASVPDLLRLAEYGRFLAQTNLDRLRPGVYIAFTTLGRYDVLLEHISAHRWYLGINLSREIGWEEAVQSWYDTIYRPMIATIRQMNILADFPGRTEADLYLWIMDHRWHLLEETGADVGAESAAISYETNYTPWSRRVVRWLDRMRTLAAQPFVLSGQLIARALASQRDGAAAAPAQTEATPERSPDALPEG